MNKIKIAIAISFSLLLESCAHQINISPNLNSIRSIDSSKKIDKKIGYYFVENKEKEVVTPGGGGDSVKYKPYKEIEDGIKKILTNTFNSVASLNSELESDKNDVDLLAEIKITTTSFSSSSMTWPPTQFGVNLNCDIKDLNGDVLTNIQAKGEGYSEYSEWFLADKGLSGKRASEDALNKFQNLILLNKKINMSNSANSEIKKNIINKEEIANSINKSSIEASITEPDINGVASIKIKSANPILSLKINGEENGESKNGLFQIKKIIKIDEDAKYNIAVTDSKGNVETIILRVKRKISNSNPIKYAELNPSLVKTQPNNDSVAIIIGIADYKNLPRADFANDDARSFYDYAIRGLGVKPENIKLLVDADAGQVEIYKAFKTWLPSRVKASTDVYIYYSGHGLPAADGQSLYLLPQLADRDLIEETAIAQSKINLAIQAAKPKSVTIFLDSCYSGAGRTGQTLLASARPIAIKSAAQVFPTDFTVFTASTAEQISSSSPDLKHGIFSYYLMRGMEGEADTNKDGKITAGEMQAYLTENVAKQASIANRVQQPQLTGDANRVLVGK
jgi:hypothetical protein